MILRSMEIKAPYSFFILFFVCVNLFSQKGPGGVGNTDGSSNLILWTNPDDFSETDGASYTTWADLSGYSSDLTQSNASLRPIVKNNIVNGYDVVRFEAANRRLGKTSFTNFPTTAISGFYVNNTGDTSDGVLSYASTASNNNFLIFRSGNLRLYRNSPRTYNLIANTNDWNIVGFGWTSAGGNSWMSLNGTNGTSVSANQNGNPILAGGDLALAGEQDGSSSPYSFDTNQAHQGDFSEVIIFNTYINDAERIIVSNYLSAKYNITISTNNFYDEDTSGEDFDFNVAGIGQALDGTNHTDSQGTGIIRINTPSALSNDDFLFWGEDVKNADYDFSSSLSTGYLERLDTKWRVSKRNDLGTVSVSVAAADLDLTDKQSCAPLKLIVSNTSTFATKTTYNLTLSSGVYTATGVSFNDNDYFTLEYIDQIVLDGATAYNGEGAFGKPNTSDDCYKLLVKTNTLTLSENGDVREVEIESGAILAVESGNKLQVTNGINNSGDIRLVGTSQLIQTHTGANLNTGTGNLFVDQTASTSSVYHSGYWTSPVSDDGVNFSIFNVLKDGSVPTAATATVGEAANINFISGLDGDGSASPIEISTRWLAKFIDASDWTRQIGSGASLKIGEGWNMKSVGANFTFKGRPNDGDYSIPISQNNFSLVGNPYPSALDAEAFITENSSEFNGTLYIYNSSDNTHVRGDYTGTYSTIVSGVSVGGGRYLPIGQGFFITRETLGTGSVTFSNSQRTITNISDTGSLVAKNSRKDKRNTDLKTTVLKLKLDFNLSETEKRSRTVAIAFRGLTDNYDRGFDAEMWGLQPTDLYLKVNDVDKPFIITGTTSFSDSLEIPLVVQVDQNRDLTFSISEKQNIDTPVYLLDKLNNVYYSLEGNSKTVNLSSGKYTNRFYLTFKNSTLSVDKNALEERFTISQDELNNEIIIKNLDAKTIKNIGIYSITGQNVLEINDIDLLKESNIKIKNLNIAASIYIIKIKTQQNLISKKFFIRN